MAQTARMDDQQLGRLVRAIRLRRNLRQVDLASAARVSHGTVSLVERGHCRKLSLETIREVATAVDIRVELIARWRGGDADRLLSRRHSLLAESFAAFMASQTGWSAEPEVSFGIYGERGIIDQLAWHSASAHLLVVELKTEFTDVNEMLGTLDRKIRLARTVAAGRGWRPRAVSAWLIVSDTKTNRRHAAEHFALFHAKFKLEGRQLRGFLLNPAGPTTGLAFWTDANGGSTRPGPSVRKARARSRSGPEPPAGAATTHADRTNRTGSGLRGSLEAAIA